MLRRPNQTVFYMYLKKSDTGFIMKQKVLFVVISMNVGGTEKALLNMLEVMGPDKFDVDLYLLEKKGGYLEDVPGWVHVHVFEEYAETKSWILDPPLQVVKRLLKKGRFLIACRLALTHILFKMTGDRYAYDKAVISCYKPVENEYDAAVAYTGPFDFVTILVREKVKARRYIQWIHFDVSKFTFNTKTAQRVYPEYHEIIVVSSAAARHLLEKMPSVKDKIKIIPNFVPITACREKASAFDPYTSVESGVMKILTVGRLTAEKGQIIIPDVVKALIEKGVSDFHWFVLGDGNQREGIEKRIADLGVSAYITMVGLEKNPYPYYQGADIYVQTSLHEGFCLTIAEALAFDKYVISTEVDGAYDQIKNDSQGCIVKRSVDDMTGAVADAIAKRRETV